jgi:hypothetical protein
MNRVGDDLLLQELERTEDYIHSCADAIDAKAGQVLAASAFLAVQPAVLLIVPGISAPLFAVQLFSFLVLLVSAILAHIVLEIDDYPSPVITEQWRDSIIESRRENATEEDVAKTILWGIINFTKTRVDTGHAMNNSKIKWLQRSRWLTTASFALNFVIISFLMIIHFF